MYAKKKLFEKNCDWIIANNVSDPSIGFGSDYNEVSIFYKNMKYEKIPKMKKSFLAENIVKKVISHLNWFNGKSFSKKASSKSSIAII